MIIDVFKDREFWRSLGQYNDEIRKVCSKYTFAKEGEDYNLKQGKVSYWYDPDYVKELHISHHYPKKVSLQYDPKFNLNLYFPNYISLYVINTLFKWHKQDLIEDEACGMGRLGFFLSKLGFTNFHFTENFTQLNQHLFEDLMKSAGIKYELNNNETNPVAINLVGWTHLTRPSIPDSVKLITVYNQDRLVKDRESIPKFFNSGNSYIKADNFRFLCKDIDNLTYVYVHKDWYDECKKELAPVATEKKEMRKTFHQYAPVIPDSTKFEVFDYLSGDAWLTEFTHTKELETEVCKFLEVKNTITCNNGTVALQLALMALGSPKKVLVPGLSMIATANAVRAVGSEPVFCDIENDTLCLDGDKANDILIKKKIDAIIYVSLNGRWDRKGGWARCLDNAKKLNIPVIEDAAQAFGSNTYRSKIGQEADITTFSMSPHKIITSGQGGLLVTNNDELAEKIRRLKDFGRISGGADVHDHFGVNHKFTDVQAIIALQQLKEIKQRIEIKKHIFNMYRNLLKDKLRFITTEDYVTPWFVDVYCADKGQRDDLLNYLKGIGIGTRPMYPPMHLQKIYNRDKLLLVTEEYSQRMLWLPSSLDLTDEEITYICNKIKENIK